MRNLRVGATDFMGYPALDLDFTGRHIVAVVGKNNHGKSALLDALTFGLYGRVGARPVDARQHDQYIRDGATMLSVTVAFTTSDGHAIEVTREKPHAGTETLSLSVDGVSSKGHTLAETQDRIAEWVGLSYDALTMTNLMVQRGSSAFMAAAPRDRKDLLITLRGLHRYKVLWKRASDELVEAKGAVRAATARLAEIEETAKRVAPARAALEQATTAVAAASAEVERINAEVADIRVALAALQERNASLTAGAGRRDALVAEEAAIRAAATSRMARFASAKADANAAEPVASGAIDRSAVTRAEQRRDAAREADTEARRLRALVSGYEGQITEATRQRAILPMVPCGGTGKYASCQFLTGVPDIATVTAFEADLVRTRAELVGIAAGAEDLTNAQIAYARLSADARMAEEAARAEAVARQAWETKREAAQTLMATLMETHEGAKARLAAVKAELAGLDVDETALAKTRSDIAAIGERQVSATDQLAEAQADLALAQGNQRTFDRAMAVIEEVLSHADEAKAEAEGAERREQIMAALVAAWNREGIPAEDIAAVVPLIEAKANEVLARLPEGLRIQMRNEPEALDVLVEIDGFERPYGLLSVGARFRIDLALRLAIGEIQTHTTGRRIEMLWLDEALADMDPEGEEAVMESLRAIGDDFGLIVVVSHRPTVSDVAEDRIEVVKEGGECRATFAA